MFPCNNHYNWGHMLWTAYFQFQGEKQEISKHPPATYSVYI